MFDLDRSKCPEMFYRKVFLTLIRLGLVVFSGVVNLVTPSYFKKN